MTQRLLHSHANQASKLEETLTPNETDHEEKDGLILKSPTDSSDDLESKMEQDPDNLYYKLERGTYCFYTVYKNHKNCLI